MRIHVLLVLGLLGSIACGDSDGSGGSAGGEEGGAGGSGGGATVEVDDAELSAMAADYATLTKVNDAPFMSAQHAGMPMVNVYVSSSAVSAYEGIASGSASFPEGTLIVKEMLDADGNPEVLTAMYKAPEGYDPENLDWWWGMLTPAGEPAMSGSVGKIGMCNDCHQAQAATDAAFGLPQ
jgi:hypothetical protein